MQQFRQILARELPFEWPRDCFAIVLKIKQTLGQGPKVCEVIQGLEFALHDRKVDFDLIEPTGMEGRVNKDESRIAVL
jgi:hypothetical protein